MAWAFWRVPPDHEGHARGLGEQRHPEGGAAQSYLTEGVDKRRFAKVNSRTNPSTYPLSLLI